MDENKKASKDDDDEKGDVTCVCASTNRTAERYGRWIEKEEERKKEKKRMLYSLCNDKSLSWVFFASKSNGSRGPLFVNIHMERTRACLNTERERIGFDSTLYSSFLCFPISHLTTRLL